MRAQVAEPLRSFLPGNGRGAGAAALGAVQSMSAQEVEALIDGPETIAAAVPWMLPALPVEARSRLRMACLQRGVADAQANNLVWTPVLDSLSASREWPVGLGDESEWSKHEAVRRLEKWLASSNSDDGLHQLLDGVDHMVREVVAARPRVLGMGLVGRLLAIDPRLGATLAYRKNLTLEEASAIDCWAVSVLSTALGSFGRAALEARIKVGRSGGQPISVEAESALLDAMTVFRSKAPEAADLLLSSTSTSASSLELVARWAVGSAPTSALVRIVAHPNSNRELSEWIWGRCTRPAELARLLVKHPQTPAYVLEGLAVRVAEGVLPGEADVLLRSIVASPAATPDVWREAARCLDCDHVDARALGRALVGRAGPRRDPVVREIVLAYATREHDITLLSRLSADPRLSARDAEASFTPIALKAPVVAARLLKKGVLPEGICLPPDALAGMFSDSRSEVREAAILVSGNGVAGARAANGDAGLRSQPRSSRQAGRGR